MKENLLKLIRKFIELDLAVIIAAPFAAIALFPIVLIAKQLFNLVLFYWNLL